MKYTDILKELLHSKNCNQLFYNQKLLEVRNPEVRQMFAQFRDDEMRSVVELEQRVDKIDSPPGIISKIFTTKSKY